MSKELVVEAIQNTKHFNGAYWQKALKQRAGMFKDDIPNNFRAGSYYPDFTPEQVEKALLDAYWEPVKSENVKPEFEAFTTPLPGILGVVPLSKLPADTKLKVDDRKNTGFASLTFKSDAQVLADDTTILISKKATSWKVVTFFPGEPIDGKRISIYDVEKKELTLEEALKLGFTNAKLVKR